MASVPVTPDFDAMEDVPVLYVAKLSHSQSAITSVSPLNEVEADDPTASADKGRYLLEKYIAWVKLPHLKPFEEVIKNCEEEFQVYASVFT